jgi:hypothetical protein
MKYEWQPEDISEHIGRIVHRGRTSEHYIIGYEKASCRNPCLISLRDGMITSTGLGVDGFAKHLNDQGFKPYVSRSKPIEQVFIDDGKYV